MTRLIDSGGSRGSTETDDSTDSTSTELIVDDGDSTSDSGGMASDIASDAEEVQSGDQVPGDQPTSTDDATADTDLVEDTSTDSTTSDSSTSDTSTSDSGGMASDIANDAEAAFGGNQVPGDQETSTDDANADPDLTDDGAHQGERVPAGEALWRDAQDKIATETDLSREQAKWAVAGFALVAGYGGYKTVKG